MKKAGLKEVDLYPPLRDFLTAQGYRVRSEVGACDVTATRDGALTVVELKRSLTLDLLVQAIKRQRVADSVYLAVPAPTTRLLQRRHRSVAPVVKRLELGLILIDPESTVPVQIAFHPVPYKLRRNQSQRKALIREQAARSTDGNRGGSTGLPLLTAYRENALLIAHLLKKHGSSRPRDIRDLGGGPQTLAILSNNVYGWFERIDRGIYALSAEGERGLATYRKVVKLLERKAGARIPTRVK